MNLFTKIEAAINALLITIGKYLLRLIDKVLPPKVKSFLVMVLGKFQKLFDLIASVPVKVKPFIMKVISFVKAKLQAYDLKTKLKEAYAISLAKQKGAKTSTFLQIKSLIMTPFLLAASWLQGLTTMQSLLLMGFTAASFLSGINMIFSGKRIVEQELEGRYPASVVSDPEYDRPIYYKAEKRHFDVTNFRLPVYVPQVNEQRTVDIDFTAEITNRAARRYLEKHEFELRDHFILNIEPVEASFPIVEEGKEIIRKKILIEINEFLLLNGIEGQVIDVKITYVLAN